MIVVIVVISSQVFYFSSVILNRCIPKNYQKLGWSVLVRVFGFLNSIDMLQQVLADIAMGYVWILMCCIIAFGRRQKFCCKIGDNFLSEKLSAVRAFSYRLNLRFSDSFCRSDCGLCGVHFNRNWHARYVLIFFADK